MKKFVVLLFIFIFCCNSVLAEDYVVNLDLYKRHDQIASKELYKYIIKRDGSPKSKINELWDITNENTYADFVDLNNDGIPEIIGFTSALSFWGSVGTSLYILKANNKNTYVNIYDSLSFYPQENIKILKEKTNNFYNIELSACFHSGKDKVSGEKKVGRFIIQFDGKFYNKHILIKELKNISR